MKRRALDLGRGSETVAQQEVFQDWTRLALIEGIKKRDFQIQALRLQLKTKMEAIYDLEYELSLHEKFDSSRCGCNHPNASPPCSYCEKFKGEF